MNLNGIHFFVMAAFSVLTCPNFSAWTDIHVRIETQYEKEK